MFMPQAFEVFASNLNSVGYIAVGEGGKIIYVSEMRNANDKIVDCIKNEDGEILATFEDVRSVLYHPNLGFFVMNHLSSTNEMQILLIRNREVEITKTLIDFNSQIAMAAASPSTVLIARCSSNCNIYQQNLNAIWTLTKQDESYSLTRIDHSMLNLSAVADICVTSDNRILIAQGYPQSCIKLIKDNQMQQIGKQANTFQMTVDGDPDKATFKDIVQCKVDVHNTIVILDNSWGFMRSVIRLVFANMQTHTLNLFSPILTSIAIRKNELFACEASGSTISIATTPYLNDEHTSGLSSSLSVRLILHDLQFNVNENNTTQTFHGHKALASHHSAMIAKQISDGRSAITLPEWSTSMACICMLEIMYEQKVAAMYTTETLLETLHLADYYGINIVSQNCRVQIIARMLTCNYDLMKVFEFCEKLGDVQIDVIHEISIKAALQAMHQIAHLSKTIPHYPEMSKLTFELISQAMNGKFVTLL